MMISFRHSAVLTLYTVLTFAITACNAPETTQTTADIPAVAEETETVEYYSLRPEAEKAFGYTHAVRLGDDIKISGAVSMDDAGNPTERRYATADEKLLCGSGQSTETLWLHLR